MISDRKRGTKEAKSRFEYAGLDIIFQLCMGDVSTILQLCKEMYHEEDSKEVVEKGISSSLQDEVIRRF